ncbi:MAG: nucleoside deaminase [Candidatus Izimaplasma sp.]|nr:nucleoside deaminase [Candidatus Izimaplasma bacterium]
MKSDQYFMSIALEEAEIAAQNNEVPIGAVIVKDGELIARAHNERENTQKTVSHAEIIAIEKANKKLQSWRLDSCTLYVTIEPCPMCAGAIIQSRIKRLVYGAKDNKSGSHQGIINLFDQAFNHRVNVEPEIKKEAASKLMKDFFEKLRQTKK